MAFVFGSHGIGITVADKETLFDRIGAALHAGRGFSVATLNLDHLVKMQGSAEFADAYAKQSFVVADGRPVVWLSRLSGHPVELAPGSDLVMPLAKLAARNDTPVALMGSTDQVLRDAADHMVKTVAGMTVAAQISPSRNFDPKGAEALEILRQLNESGAGICFLALGAPKQEVFAALGRELAPGVGFVSVGAGLDFIAGTQKRAPFWMRAIAMEWLWRALSSPSRMIPRYAKCFAILPGLFVRALRTRALKL